MEYYTLQESGILPALQEKMANLEIGLHGMLEQVIWEAMENKIEELPEDTQQEVQDEIYSLASDLESHIENLIFDL
tara:strand:- start:11861 stop:12088 length:228 start_codon:yes stop_codon:yes gene_type:complete